MKTTTSTTAATSLAASVAPEDLERGDWVAVLSEMVEWPTFFWCNIEPCERDDLVRLKCIPADSGTPLKIKAVCLPFVFVKTPQGECETIDVRRVQLVRLQKQYAKLASKRLRQQLSQDSD